MANSSLPGAVSALRTIRPVLARLRSWAEKHTPEHFLVLFGSYAVGNARAASDIDAILFCEGLAEHRRVAFQELFRALCEPIGADLHPQIPLEKYLVSSFAQLSEAFTLRAFPKEGRRVVVPPRIERPEFYRSQEMIDRFLLNAMTSRHVLVSIRSRRYIHFRHKAFDTLIALILLSNGIKACSLDELVELAIHDGTSGRSGAQYLGYMDRPAIRRHLRSALGKRLENLRLLGTLATTATGFEVVDSAWLARFLEVG